MNKANCILLFVTSVAIIALVNSTCEDVSNTVDIGWSKPQRCGFIKRKFPIFCSNKNLVKVTCASTCGNCGFDPCLDCVDSKGKFIVGNVQKRCAASKKNPNLCNREEFRFNCPKTCGICNTNTGCASFVGGGGSGGGSSGSNEKSTECSGKAPDCCLGLTNTCNMKVDELFFAAMHNANNDEDKWNSNHEGSLEDALKAGFRAFYLDVCYCQGRVVFCHGNCIFAGQQDPTEIFTNVVSFLDENPSELVFFNFEISAFNPTPQMLWNVMKEVDGLKDKSYIHNGGQWPSIGSLLKDGKQIISLKHNGDNCLNTSNSGCTPYIQEWFKFVVGTNYSFQNFNQIQDIESSCVGHRGTAYRKDFYAINNFITLVTGPSEVASATLNTDSFVEKRISDCERIMKMDANFVAVDFWQIGNVAGIAKEINKERADVRRRFATHQMLPIGLGQWGEP